MKKIKQLPRKLVLTTETLRKLSPEQLGVVAGGRPTETHSIITAVECR